MKYNTISTSSLASEGKKPSFTIYADMNISQNKMADTEAEIISIRGELEIVQKALKLQTKRCRQLVAEYTKRLQQKEQQYQSEKMLRDDQLAKVLRALLIFEARLKQEQKIISNQLKEKDYIIKKQSNDIKKLLSNQYCKNCQQYYSLSSNLESFDSSSDYVITDYQSSNFESLDSSSDIYATISEKSYNLENTDKSDEKYDETKNIYQKNKGKDFIGKRSKKFQHRKSVGTYFEVLKLRNDNLSPCSNEDNTSNDYDHLDSLPSENITNKTNSISDRTDVVFDDNKEESSSNISTSECNNTVINNNNDNEKNETNNLTDKKPKISESIPVFEGDGETNDNWYASASDQEDEEHRDIYRNNPVLECMNQILLQNINDPLNSPPKTPNIERKSTKNKKVKFSDEDDGKPSVLTEENVKEKSEEAVAHDYYETPIQKIPNFYETPQSIYSNDYEQILSKCSETFSTSSKSDPGANSNNKKLNKDNKGHFYIDMDITKLDNNDCIKDNNNQQRKVKILRTPPALPPKPANLLSKYKVQNKLIKDNIDLLESEPDYCSISELNLPTKNVSFKKINVVAEINPPNSQDVINKLEKASTNSSNTTTTPTITTTVTTTTTATTATTNETTNLIVKKCVEKLNIQLAKQTPIKSDLKKIEQEIPKLPQVSEIIIPDDNDDNNKKNDDERISHDNYVKNNSQILKLKNRKDQNRGPIVMGTSVSSLITGFNNQQLISEIQNKKPSKLDRKLFSSFENLQNLDNKKITNNNNDMETPNFDQFDLSQNFEEFKLDDCEIEEYNVDEDLTNDENNLDNNSLTTRVDIIRATNNDVLMPSLTKNSVELLKKQLELQKNKVVNEQNRISNDSSTQYRAEPTYEHFLECTGLSSKSILTPSRLLSNHKSMLKPKDVKLRSKVKANSLFDRHSSGTIKYWSEPYI